MGDGGKKRAEPSIIGAFDRAQFILCKTGGPRQGKMVVKLVGAL
jgi:hypothetical protein